MPVFNLVYEVVGPNGFIVVIVFLYLYSACYYML